MANRYEVTTGKKVANWITARFAGAGLGNFVVLTTLGNRTSKPRSVTVAPIRDFEGEYLVCPYGEVAWVRNVRANPEVTIRRGRSKRAAKLVEMTGRKPELLREYHQREAFARRFMDVPDSASLADFEDAGSRFPVFRIESPH